MVKNYCFRLLPLLLVISSLFGSGCYIYTNPYDPLVEPSVLDIAGVTVEYYKATEDSGEKIVINWPDIEDADEYKIIASQTKDGFLYEEYYPGTELSEFCAVAGWEGGEWLSWPELYFRIGYRINWSEPVWSDIFHYPLSCNNPIDGGISLSAGPVLDWADAEGATAYDIDYAKTEDGLDGIVDTATSNSDSSYWEGLGIAVDDTIYWRYRAEERNDDAVTELWSRIFSFTVKPIPEIGDLYAGGYIFYLDSGNGLILTDEKIAEEVRWGPAGTDIAGDDDTAAPELTAIGSGQADTTAIITALGENGGEFYPARICDDLDYRGFTDWYLPSKDELDEICSALRSIDWKIFPVSGVNSGRGAWSSSEYDADNAYVRHAEDVYVRYKYGLHDVWAVRNFSY